MEGLKPLDGWPLLLSERGSRPRRHAGPQISGVNPLMVRSRGLEPPHPYGYMHLKHARLPIPPRPRNSLFDPTSSHTYLKLVRLSLRTACVSVAYRTTVTTRGRGHSKDRVRSSSGMQSFFEPERPSSLSGVIVSAVIRGDKSHFLSTVAAK